MEDQKNTTGGHPARSPNFRKATGYVSDRHEYYSEYYQKNKVKLQAKKRDRYKGSTAIREYHKLKSREYYQRNRVSTGRVNRTILTTEDGSRLYSVRHAANAIGFSVPYFRDLIRKGIIPDASHKNKGGWRMYTAGQIKLLRRAMSYYHQYTDPGRTQAVLFTFWEDPETGMAMSPDKCLTTAMKAMVAKTNKQIKLKE